MAEDTPTTETKKKSPSKAGSKPEGGASTKKSAKAGGADAAEDTEKARAEARARLDGTGRNDPCPCGSGKKYKKCHLLGDEEVAIVPPTPPSAQELLANAWRLFEQRRPGAAEKEFRAALELDADLIDARVGIGMARLAASDADAAKAELGAVVEAAAPQFAKLREDKVTDAFSRPEAQPVIRAAHALGCLAYDQERWADAVADLERVYSIDGGTVGTEARLIAAKALIKLEKAADAIPVLEPAVKADSGAARARVGLALAQFLTGAEEAAEKTFAEALEANPHFAKALLGRIRRRVDNLAGTQPGSIEEALVYAQTYGDVWTDDAKKLLEKTLGAE
jgi:tetratricopeptide (TPR) repeat protein